MTFENEGVDVIVRFHDVARTRELTRAVFSLYGQELRPVRILLVLQRFSEEDEASVRAALAPLLSLPDAPDLTICRHDSPLPLDARSALVNLGLQAATARYVALLDYDDVLYPEAYRMLTEQLKESGAGIAFGNIGVKLVDVYDDFLHAHGQHSPFKGSTLTDLLRSNFCPIHSFVVDRARVPASEMRFEPNQTIEEDYEFLLRVCACVKSDFTLVHTRIGEYYYKSDNSNTVGSNSVIPPATRARIEAAVTFNEGRRRITPLSAEVQEQLGLSEYRPALTIAAYLQEVSQ
ncbi:glycosyltransferase [Pseudoroseomonas wenyumeiae]